MRWWWLLAIGGLAWLVLRPGAAPAWYRDLMLRGYAGTLVVVSHDEDFLQAIGLTDRLVWSPQGWRMEPA